MISSLPDDTTGALSDEILDALRHYYDLAYLARHPLLARLPHVQGIDTAVAVSRLRRHLVELIDRLQPGAEVSETEPAWRPHAVLFQRFILGKELCDLETELGLSARQIQREQRRAIEALEQMLLCEMGPLRAPKDGERSSADGSALQREISLAAGSRQRFDLVAQVAEVAEVVAPLARRQGLLPRIDEVQGPLYAVGSPTLFRQLLVSAATWVLQMPEIVAVRLGAHRRDDDLVVGVAATSRHTIAARSAPPRFPESLRALAQSQQIALAMHEGAHGWRAELCWCDHTAPRTIAVIEDNPDIIALFARCLTRRGFRIVGLTESDKAFDGVLDLDPDMVVLDIMMSRLDGWDLLRRLRTDARTQNLPVIICSALEQEPLASALGADAYLRKPVRPEDLVSCLAGLHLL